MNRLLLLTLVTLLAFPTAAQAKAPTRAAYIKTADALCRVEDGEFTPAVEGSEELLTTNAYSEAGAEAIMASARATKATFTLLRALPRPAADRNALIRYFNADSERITAVYNVGVDEANEEPLALGTDLIKADTAKILAQSAVASYGFKVCGK